MPLARGCSGLAWFLCLPLTHLVDVPDTVYEVLTALLLVAGINYIVIYASKLSLGWVGCVRGEGEVRGHWRCVRACASASKLRAVEALGSKLKVQWQCVHQ